MQISRNQLAFKGAFIIPDKHLRTGEQNQALKENKTLVEEPAQKNFVNDTPYYTTGIIYHNNSCKEEETRSLLNSIKLPYIHIKAPVQWSEIEALSKAAQKTQMLNRNYDAQ